MAEQFGSDPEEIFTAIGPSICQDCYEVSEDVILEFQKAFEEKYWEKLFYKKKNGKYQLNLWEANHIIFLEARRSYFRAWNLHLLQSGIPLFPQGIPWKERKSGSFSGHSSGKIM